MFSKLDHGPEAPYLSENQVKSNKDIHFTFNTKLYLKFNR